MKIKKAVLKLLDTNKGLALIMSTLDVAPTTARDYVKSNSENLTKAAMIKAIEKEYGLKEKDILEDSKVKEPQS